MKDEMRRNKYLLSTQSGRQFRANLLSLGLSPRDESVPSALAIEAFVENLFIQTSWYIHTELCACGVRPITLEEREEKERYWLSLYSDSEVPLVWIRTLKNTGFFLHRYTYFSILDLDSLLNDTFEESFIFRSFAMHFLKYNTMVWDDSFFRCVGITSVIAQRLGYVDFDLITGIDVPSYLPFRDALKMPYDPFVPSCKYHSVYFAIHDSSHRYPSSNIAAFFPYYGSIVEMRPTRTNTFSRMDFAFDSTDFTSGIHPSWFATEYKFFGPRGFIGPAANLNRYIHRYNIPVPYCTWYFDTWISLSSVQSYFRDFPLFEKYSWALYVANFDDDSNAVLEIFHKYVNDLEVDVNSDDAYDFLAAYICQIVDDLTIDMAFGSRHGSQMLCINMLRHLYIASGYDMAYVLNFVLHPMHYSYTMELMSVEGHAFQMDMIAFVMFMVTTPFKIIKGYFDTFICGYDIMIFCPVDQKVLWMYRTSCLVEMLAVPFENIDWLEGDRILVRYLNQKEKKIQCPGFEHIVHRFPYDSKYCSPRLNEMYFCPLNEYVLFDNQSVFVSGAMRPFIFTVFAWENPRHNTMLDITYLHCTYNVSWAFRSRTALPWINVAKVDFDNYPDEFMDFSDVDTVSANNVVGQLSDMGILDDYDMKYLCGLSFDAPTPLFMHQISPQFIKVFSENYVHLFQNILDAFWFCDFHIFHMNYVFRYLEYCGMSEINDNVELLDWFTAIDLRLQDLGIHTELAFDEHCRDLGLPDIDDGLDFDSFWSYYWNENDIYVVVDELPIDDESYGEDSSDMSW
jgi:hypothetical protein